MHVTNLVCQDSQCHVHNERLEFLSGKSCPVRSVESSTFDQMSMCASARMQNHISLLLLLVHCKVLLIRQMLACLKTSLINSIVFCQHLLKSPQLIHNQHVGNRDSSDHVSGVCGKLRINLPTKSDQWKIFLKATLVPFVLESSDVNNKFSALLMVSTKLVLLVLVQYTSTIIHKDDNVETGQTIQQ